MLKLFFFNAEQEYHVRGIVRLLDEEINAVRRELKNLYDIDLLSSQKKGNKLFYLLNRDHLLYNELRGLLYKDEAEIIGIYQSLKAHAGIEIAVLTQNFIDNKYENEYDVDLMLVGQFEIQKLKLEMQALEKDLGRTLRYTIMSPRDLQFQLKKRDDFLLNIIKNDKIILIGSDKDIA